MIDTLETTSSYKPPPIALSHREKRPPPPPMRWARRCRPCSLWSFCLCPSPPASFGLHLYLYTISSSSPTFRSPSIFIGSGLGSASSHVSPRLVSRPLPYIASHSYIQPATIHHAHMFVSSFAHWHTRIHHLLQLHSALECSSFTHSATWHQPRHLWAHAASTRLWTAQSAVRRVGCRGDQSLAARGSGQRASSLRLV